jgi:CelD/BcsL family acetyltransferase involved in cellulose biosynthesis
MSGGAKRAAAGDTTMQLDVYTDPQMLHSLAGEWSALLPATAHNSIFATPEWAQQCWRAFGDGRDLCLMTVRDGNDLIGVVPLSVEQQEGRQIARFLPYLEVTDYEDIVARAGLEHDVWRLAMGFLDQQPWELDLHNIPGASPTIEFFRTLGRAGAHDVSIAAEDVCPLIRPLPADFETYLNSLDKKDRHELRRKLRRLLGDSDLGTEVSWRQDDLAQAMDDFVRLHKLSSADKEQFMTPRMVGFFSSLAHVCRERGWLSLAFLSVAGKRVSTIMAFDYGDTYYLYNSGYDPEFEYLSVGLLLKALAIEYAIKTGKACYDFLQGNERYKYDLGGKDTEVCSVRCTRSGK